MGTNKVIHIHRDLHDAKGKPVQGVGINDNHTANVNYAHWDGFIPKDLPKGTRLAKITQPDGDGGDFYTTPEVVDACRDANGNIDMERLCRMCQVADWNGSIRGHVTYFEVTQDLQGNEAMMGWPIVNKQNGDLRMPDGSRAPQFFLRKDLVEGKVQREHDALGKILDPEKGINWSADGVTWKFVPNEDESERRSKLEKSSGELMRRQQEAREQQRERERSLAQSMTQQDAAPQPLADGENTRTAVHTSSQISSVAIEKGRAGEQALRPGEPESAAERLKQDTMKRFGPPAQALAPAMGAGVAAPISGIAGAAERARRDATGPFSKQTSAAEGKQATQGQPHPQHTAEAQAAHRRPAEKAPDAEPSPPPTASPTTANPAAEQAAEEARVTSEAEAATQTEHALQQQAAEAEQAQARAQAEIQEQAQSQLQAEAEAHQATAIPPQSQLQEHDLEQARQQAQADQQTALQQAAADEQAVRQQAQTQTVWQEQERQKEQQNQDQQQRQTEEEQARKDTELEPRTGSNDPTAEQAAAPPGHKDADEHTPPGYKPSDADAPPGYKNAEADSPPGYHSPAADAPPGYKSPEVDSPPGYQNSGADSPPGPPSRDADAPVGYAGPEAEPPGTGGLLEDAAQQDVPAPAAAPPGSSGPDTPGVSAMHSAAAEPPQETLLDQPPEPTLYGGPGGASLDDLDTDMRASAVESTTLDDWDSQHFQPSAPGAVAQTEEEVDQLAMSHDTYAPQDIGQAAAPMAASQPQPQQQAQVETATQAPEPAPPPPPTMTK